MSIWIYGHFGPIPCSVITETVQSRGHPSTKNIRAFPEQANGLKSLVLCCWNPANVGNVPMLIDKLATNLALGPLLEDLRACCGGYQILAHWQQGEFHHDLVLELNASRLPGTVLVVATNCNGGVKELLCFDEAPTRQALWHHRCPQSPDFEGQLPPILAQAHTHHWFDPCELLKPDARSEYKAEYRQRQEGGGWIPKDPQT